LPVCTGGITKALLLARRVICWGALALLLATRLTVFFFTITAKQHRTTSHNITQHAGEKRCANP
jgi:hypothetical protein